MTLKDYEMIPTSMHFFWSATESGPVWKIKGSQERFSIMILCHLSPRSDSGGREIKKDEQVILAHEDPTDIVHCLCLCLSLSLSLIMEKLAQEDNPLGN